MIIAVDGPAASGKGTIARALAGHFNLPHLDTGLLYRAVGVQALDDGRGVLDLHWAAELARRLVPEALERDGLRTARAGQAASKVAALPEVRAALLDFQRRFARQSLARIKALVSVPSPEAALPPGAAPRPTTPPPAAPVVPAGAPTGSSGAP